MDPNEAEELLRKLGPLMEGWRLAIGGLDKTLLNEAKKAERRAAHAKQTANRQSEIGATAAAILCGAAACEARLSEYLAHYEAVSGPLPSVLRDIRGKPNAREQWKALVRSHVKSFDFGQSEEFLHLGCLFKLRDLVAHRNARLELVGSVPEQIEDCIRQKVIPADPKEAMGWPSVLLIAEVGKWAHRTAARWLQLMDNVIPLSC